MTAPKVVFSTEFPVPAVPTLPEYFRKNMLDGLLPGQISFPFSTAVKYDLSTGLLYAATKHELSDNEITPPSYGVSGRAAIMRLLEPTENGEVIDGFIADLRQVKAGGISSCTVHIPEQASVFDVKYSESEQDRQGYKPLLAVVFKDPDGNPHFMGDERLKPHMERLIEEADLATPNYDNVNEPGEPTNRPDEFVTGTGSIILGPEVYLG